MAVRSGPLLRRLHMRPPTCFAHLRPPLFSLLRTIPLHVVRPRIRNFSSCEGTTSGTTLLSSAFLFLSSRLSSPRFFLVSLFTWELIFRAASRQISVVATFSLCVHHVLSRVSLQASSIQLVSHGSSLSGKQFERHDSQHASKPLRVHRGPVIA